MSGRSAVVRSAVAALLAAAVSSALGAGKVGFEEDFALAPDRAAVLKQLIPGTEDYYYYSALHAQNQGKLDEVDKLLEPWIRQHNRTSRVVEIEHRQALLKYAKDAKGSLSYLIEKLGLHYPHQRETLGQMVSLPTELDAKLIGREAMKKRAMDMSAPTLSGFEDSALDWLIDSHRELSDQRLSELITRLRRPDYADLPKIVARNLTTPYYSHAFGSQYIHGAMLLSQLDELLKLRPQLLNDGAFVHIYIQKLRPPVGVDWKHDAKEYAAYMDRLWAFVSRLGPGHNSLKAHVLYQRLAFDRKQGEWNKQRFIEYLKLPRNLYYVNPDYMEPQSRKDHPVDFNYSAPTLLPPIVMDEPLVRSYLLQLLVDAEDYDDYKPYVRENYLQALFAEAKLTAGVGDAEKWFALLGPTQVQALKDRVDIDFAYTNKELFAPDDAVSVDVDIKNVKTLIVKVYEINAANYYKTFRRDVTTDINLDGLVANEERTIEYKDTPPLRRVQRNFKFENLKGRGVWVVELIGNGKSSRALIRKGKLRFIERPGAAGHVFTVMDESNRLVKDARLWLAGHEYEADKDGTVNVPYSTNPGSQPVAVMSGDFASLEQFSHLSEAYRFTAGVHVPRESLIKYGTATVAIRPALFLNQVQVSPRLLKDVVLTITSVDADGISTSKEIPDFAVYEDRETEQTFAVPDRLRSISFTLRGKVENITNSRKDDVTFSKSFQVNAVDATASVEDLHFSKIAGSYSIDVLGKNGELRPDRPLSLVIKHKDFREPLHVSLKSDAKGRVSLGKLEGITYVTATGPEGTHTWSPVEDGRTYVAALHGRDDEVLKVPYMGTAKEAVRPEFSLLELRDGGTFYADKFDALTVKDGFLEIKGLPAGDYSLLLKGDNVPITLRIARGTFYQDWLLSDRRYLQLMNRTPLQITSATAAADKITVRMANVRKEARVHVYATRFVPAFSPEADLDAGTTPAVFARGITPQESVYVSGRKIGDEYRYIIDRKYATKYPGVMLDRPGLLLNPWAIRKTDTGQQEAEHGTAYDRAGAGGAGGTFGDSSGKLRGRGVAGDISNNLDFLPETTSVMLNLMPDKDGVITIDRKKLGAHNQVHIVAVDPFSTVYREVSLEQPEVQVRDFRLKTPLEAGKHFTEQKQVTVLGQGDSVTIRDEGANLEVYDTLGKVYRLYSTLKPDATLAEFSFVLTWPTLAPEKKRELYSKYACHELNFFLFKRDPEFFKTVVQPYLKNKRDKTFMDHYLLGDDLSAYTKPWAFGRLNTVERVLLGQRVAGEGPRIARAVKDRFDLTPPNIEAYNTLFATAIKGSSLEQSVPAGIRPMTPPPTTRPSVAAESSDLSASAPAGPAANGRSSLAAAMQEATPVDREMGRKRGEAAKKEAALDDLSDAGKANYREQMEKNLEKRQEGKDSADMPFESNAPAWRADLRRFYRKLDKTMEWVENNYYHLPIEQQLAGLVNVNGLWKDYAALAGGKTFLSKNVAQPTSNFTEMMFALSVIDLPFEAPKHGEKRDGGTYVLNTAGSAIAFHKEIKESLVAEEKTPILVSQNYYRASDRYMYVDNERTDKYVKDEFLTHVVYGCQVVVTNPTSSRQKLDALMQLPKGAMPVLNAQYTRGLHVELQPYETKAIEYAFYFPVPGEFPHYPVQVAKNEKFVAGADPTTMKVVAIPSKVDTTSWDYVSQNGTSEQVLTFLADNNIERLNLEKIAWRMNNADFFKKTAALLSERHVYNNTLWSYALKHDEAASIREYLQHQDGFLAQCGAYIDSPLVKIDPVIRYSYEHMEYAPLVNARAHRLGSDRMIVNDRMYQQYERTLNVLKYHPALGDDDKMAATYYLLLQDRVDEGLAFFKQVEPKNLAERVQYDYFTAYGAFYSDNPTSVRPLVDGYKDYPVDRWRKLFANVSSQLDELQGKRPQIVNTDDRNQQQNQLVSTEPAFDFRVDAKQVILDYRNVQTVRVNYYLMDLELLFSENPFLAAGAGGQFSLIKPNATADVKLDGSKSTLTFAMPEKFLTSNVMVEIVGGGINKSQAYYANSLTIAVAENYGQMTVTSQSSGKALPKAYVKVYAQMKNGRTKFYKDGYTDVRGKFDYTSLSTDELDNVNKFSLLVMTDTDGAIVREAMPPKR